MSGYPGYNNPHPSHRGQFNPQQQQMGVSGNPSMAMGNFPQGGIMGQQQNQVQSNVGVQSPSHMQQQTQQFQMQQQMGSGNLQQHPQQMNPNMNNPQGPSTSSQHHPNVQPTPHTNTMLAITQPNPHKEINIVMLSRLGQETVQDITSRFQEIFAALKIIQPMANRDNNTEKKVQEYFRTIRLLFKRVRIIYEKCNDGCPQIMEYTNVETLIPFKDETDHRAEPTLCEEYRKALQENQELIETVKLKNRQLREIIDRTRIIIWEINTMLSMRRS